MRRYLLDTNVVVWLLLGDRRAVPEDVAGTLADPTSTALVSAASVWEIALKRSLGKIHIEDSWLRTLLSLDLDQLTITAEHAAAVQTLPWHHRDPFDRLLVAQAQVEDCVLVTADRQLDEYGVDTWWGDAG